MPTRFWEIASGCICFQFYNLRKKKFGLGYTIFPLVSIFGIFFTLFLSNQYAVINTILIVIFTLLIIYFYDSNKKTYLLLSNPKLTFIGRISYSLYLWHWIIICISRWTIGISYWSIPIQIILIFSLSIFSYLYIEQPIRNNKIVFKKKKISYLVSLCSIGVTSFFLYSLNQFTRNEIIIPSRLFKSTRGKGLGQKYPVFPQKYLMNADLLKKIMLKIPFI